MFWKSKNPKLVSIPGQLDGFLLNTIQNEIHRDVLHPARRGQRYDSPYISRMDIYRNMQIIQDINTFMREGLYEQTSNL